MKSYTHGMLLSVSAAILICVQTNATAQYNDEPLPDEHLIRKVEKRVELLRKWRVLEALDPSDEVANRLFPLLSHYDKRDRELNGDREVLTLELRRVLEEERENAGLLGDLLLRLHEIEDEKCRLGQARDEGLADLLTIEQRACLFVVLDDFHREVHQLIQQARRRPDGMERNRPPGHGRPGR